MLIAATVVPTAAIVTGASKGIGRGIATALAAAGARVAVNYSSDREGAEQAAQAIINSGSEAIAVGADVSKAADVARLFRAVDAAFGRLDVLVNNAGIFRFGAVADITEASFHAHYNINVLGSILAVQQAIQRFGAEGGSVINLSSVVGSHPVAGAVLYASTKRAIETLTKGLALELAPRKIRVNAIAAVVQAIQPTKRFERRTTDHAPRHGHRQYPSLPVAATALPL
jgi:3-oxoacyl-[acyl-carrier protein] reductase